MSRMIWCGLVAVVGFGSGCGGHVGTQSTPESPVTGPSDDSGGAAAAEPDASGSVTRADAASDAEVAYTVTLTMSGFTVPAGGEVYKCQDFANPFQGKQVDIKDQRDVQRKRRILSSPGY